MKIGALYLALCASALYAQETTAPKQETPPAEQKPAITSEFFNSIKWRSLGPTTMGGRIMDIAVYEKEPRLFYIATSTGGLWKTENGGMTLSPVYDRGNTPALGAVAVCQSNPDIVYIGMGEPGSRNSSGWGDGVLKSTDGGKTWTHLGLKDSRHVSRILIHPKNPDIVYVGALGHLWGPNDERGVYKTTDGGKTWNRVLFVNSLTGPADMVMNGRDPEQLVVGMWQRQRFAYNFISGGPGSGMYRTTNGGRSWSKVTRGLPTTPIGRIGLSNFRKDPNIVIATVENREGGVFRSTDGGQSWTKINTLNPRPFYFSRPHQDPLDVNRIYLFAVSMHYSDDQGKTFRTLGGNVHPDHHAAWVDPTDSNHIIVGNDGGVAQSRDRGRTWEHINRMPLGQFYAVAVDMRKPYYVYGGLQDNGSWGGPTQTRRGGVSFYDWYGIGGGDGFHVQVDPNDWTTVYSESQGGAIQRINQAGGPSRFIRPRAPEGERYRFNWSSPIVLSPHNSRTVFFGGNKLFKSVDRGDNWKVISPDLSTNNPAKQTPGRGSVTPENTGAETHCTIITISESATNQGVIWVGTDDGLVWVTQDDGDHWTNVTSNIPGLPPSTWCTRVTASKFAPGRCYATFDGHRNDDYTPYIFVTEDYGKSWTRLGSELQQDEVCHVIKEGERNPNLLIVGTESSLRISLDRGKSFQKYAAENWPTVPVHDVVIHPRELDLVVATHGRSIMILPFAGLEQLTTERLNADAFLCTPQTVYTLGRVSGSSWDGDAMWVSPNTQPSSTIFYHLKADSAAEARIIISDVVGTTIGDFPVPAKAGLNSFLFAARRQGQPLAPGDYRVTLKIGDKEYVAPLKVEDASAGA